MESQDIWQQFTTLTPSDQQEVADFIAFLKQRGRKPQSPEQPNQQDLRSEPFLGLWQDREDLQESTQWVRATRSKEWLL